MACRACGNRDDNRLHVFKEQHLGLGEEFEYIECAVCKSLSIMNIPVSMEKYYPSSYYSFAARPYSQLLGFLKRERDLAFLGKKNIIGIFLSLFLPTPLYIPWLQKLGLPGGASILDVGSGAGNLVVNLRDAGFRATGIDPFIDVEISYVNGARVLKQTLEETIGAFDCIMLHHCIEHMPEPREAMMKIASLLKPGGKVLIRTPVAGMHAWKIYGSNWFQLDAPRHFVIFSEQGLRMAAEKSGLKNIGVVYDSKANQFWASEQYNRGIPLAHESSHAVNPNSSMFSRAQIQEYERQARLLNAHGDGDQAAFYFEKVKENA